MLRFFGVGCLLFLLSLPVFSYDRVTPLRARKYSAFRAHSILPENFRYVIHKNGKHLFAGLEAALDVPQKDVTVERVMLENRKITQLVNKQAPFGQVARQMGFVSGLVAVLVDPSETGPKHVNEGFDFYLDKKLDRFHFVFDGYPGPTVTEDWLSTQLQDVVKTRTQYRDILTKGYRQVNGNSRYLFDERHPVFGVCSIYFSNVARLSAHLWYHAWAAADGDLTRTPLLRENLSRLK
ncbi:hypothetical protein [Acanthopleuribacter pedis]|uniref:Uncharacterized protein n=1 Tax=Acanthopleuribacter pedis TaxID=442870 RepID=A0A8J7QIH9_9BACT|nr:hypothetical protein [Acanthopleuribacter pedis]MBO1321356.1 hypothetical protein [Acanthopleuribacter pedis]